MIAGWAALEKIDMKAFISRDSRSVTQDADSWHCKGLVGC